MRTDTQMDIAGQLLAEARALNEAAGELCAKSEKKRAEAEAIIEEVKRALA